MPCGGGKNHPINSVIHTVGPYYDLKTNPKASLRNAYRNSLILAKEKNIRYIAFPNISCGFQSSLVLFLDDVYDVWLNKAKELFGT
ncbi:hypothetical protein QYF36_009336 [Acer negundo]|nr:hypothetical protein QYF36_009336 [Acer negundo]